jgi:hypothetical protein
MRGGARMAVGRRLTASVVVSLALNLGLAVWLAASRWLPAIPDRGGVAGVRIDEFLAPTPKPQPTPPAHWDRLDAASVRYERTFPDHLQIVISAARQAGGAPSDAPAVYRVDIAPARVRAGELLHIRAYTSPDANGVYVRFAIWEIAVDPAGPGRFGALDRDFPGQPYELFERDYRMPPIPRLLSNRSYGVLFAAVGRSGLASGTYVPLFLEAGTGR